MNPNWYYYLDPQEPRPKSIEEQLAELPTLLPGVPNSAPPAPPAELLWGGLFPAPSQSGPWPDTPASAAPKSLPPLFPRWPDYVMTTAGVPAKIAGWDDVPATPALPVQWPAASATQSQAMLSAPAVPYTESANYWGAGPKAAADPQLVPYLAPVPPAPDWNDMRTKFAGAPQGRPAFADYGRGASASPLWPAPPELPQTPAPQAQSWMDPLLLDDDTESDNPLVQSGMMMAPPSGRPVWDVQPGPFSVPDAAMPGNGPLFVQSGMMSSPPAMGPQFPPPPESRADAAFRTSLERWGVLGDIGRKLLFGDPDATFRVAINEETGRPATSEDYRTYYGHLPWYDRPAPPDAEDATKLALTLMGGGMAFARRGAIGMPGGFIRPPGFRKFTREESEGLRQLFKKKAKDAQELLDKLERGEHVSVPRSVTRDTLETYVLGAQKPIGRGKDRDNVHAIRLKIIRILLSRQ